MIETNICLDMKNEGVLLVRVVDFPTKHSQDSVSCFPGLDA